MNFIQVYIKYRPGYVNMWNHYSHFKCYSDGADYIEELLDVYIEKMNKNDSMPFFDVIE